MKAIIFSLFLLVFTGLQAQENSDDLGLGNVFTPNNDGVNDVFEVANPDAFQAFEMHIYNRFGQLLFSSKTPFLGWDGTILGTQVTSGSYFYVINYQMDGQEEKQAKGTVQVVIEE